MWNKLWKEYTIPFFGNLLRLELNRILDVNLPDSFSFLESDFSCIRAVLNSFDFEINQLESEQKCKDLFQILNFAVFGYVLHLVVLGFSLHITRVSVRY